MYNAKDIGGKGKHGKKHNTYITPHAATAAAVAL